MDWCFPQNAESGFFFKKDTDTKHTQGSQHRAECGLRNVASSGGDSQKRCLILGVKGCVLQVNSNETLPSHSDSTLEARGPREPHPLPAPFTHSPGSFQGNPQASECVRQQPRAVPGTDTGKLSPLTPSTGIYVFFCFR